MTRLRSEFQMAKSSGNTSLSVIYIINHKTILDLFYVKKKITGKRRLKFGNREIVETGKKWPFLEIFPKMAEFCSEPQRN